MVWKFSITLYQSESLSLQIYVRLDLTRNFSHRHNTGICQQLVQRCATTGASTRRCWWERGVVSVRVHATLFSVKRRRAEWRGRAGGVRIDCTGASRAQNTQRRYSTHLLGARLQFKNESLLVRHISAHLVVELDALNVDCIQLLRVL